jgi:outer membrane protein TolC
VRQAEVALSTDEESLLEAKNFFMERQFQLKRLILGSMNMDNDAVFLPSCDLCLVGPLQHNRANLMRDAFQNRLDYKQAVKEAEAQNLRLRYAQNQLWPRLDLVGTYGYNGLQSSFSNSLSNAFSTKTPSWSAGLQVSIPLGNIQGRSQLAMAKSGKQQAILKIKQTELNASLDVDSMLSRIETNRQSVETSRQTRRLGEETMKIQEKQIEQGLISVIDALDTRKKLFDARAREVSAIAELNKSYVLLDVATGTLLKKHSIKVVE